LGNTNVGKQKESLPAGKLLVSGVYMQVIINGEVDEVPAGASIRDVLLARNIPLDIVIVDLNGEIIRRENWDKKLVSGDVMELVRIVGGG
jgi:thiamine biosynthesis protein ThiS